MSQFGRKTTHELEWSKAVSSTLMHGVYEYSPLSGVWVFEINPYSNFLKILSLQWNYFMAWLHFRGLNEKHRSSTGLHDVRAIVNFQVITMDSYFDGWEIYWPSPIADQTEIMSKTGVVVERYVGLFRWSNFRDFRSTYAQCSNGSSIMRAKFRWPIIEHKTTLASQKLLLDYRTETII